MPNSHLAASKTWQQNHRSVHRLANIGGEGKVSQRLEDLFASYCVILGSKASDLVWYYSNYG